MTGEMANATVPVAAGKGLRIYKFNSLDTAFMAASIHRMVEAGDKIPIRLPWRFEDKTPLIAVL